MRYAPPSEIPSTTNVTTDARTNGFAPTCLTNDSFAPVPSANIAAARKITWIGAIVSITDTGRIPTVRMAIVQEIRQRRAAPAPGVFHQRLGQRAAVRL